MKAKLPFILILISKMIFSQNSVKNGDFEFYKHCPLMTDDLSVLDWKCAAGTIDYYNMCGYYIYCGLPMNSHGFCYPLSGNGCLGLIVTSNFGYQEFALGELTAPLKKNEIYIVRFYVKPGDLNQYFSTWNIGIKFSDSILFDPDRYVNKTKYPFLHSDHYINTIYPNKIKADISNKIYNFLTNESGWTEICGYYQAKGYRQVVTKR